MDQESVSALALIWRALLTTAKLLGLSYLAMWVIWGGVALLFVAFATVAIVVTILATPILSAWKWLINR